MYKGYKICVIAPCYNEEKKIGLVVSRAKAVSYLDEVIIVDDGSTDQSKEVALSLKAHVISLNKVLGVGKALLTGMEYAKNHFDIIVIMAGNNKDNPDEIYRLLDPIVENRAVFVQGSRYLKGGALGGDMPLYRKLATRLHPFLFSLFVGKKVTESTNGFRAFKSNLLNDSQINLQQEWLEGYALEPYLYYKLIALGYPTTEVPVTKIYPSRKVGNTKMTPILDWWAILKPLFYLRLGVYR